MKMPYHSLHRTELLLMVFCGLCATFDSAFAQTWTQTTAPTKQWTSIASSSDGTKLIGVSGSSVLLSSTNSGATWNTNSMQSYISVSSSADGNYLAAAGDAIFTSTNAGITWTRSSNGLPALAWYGIASSADGSRLIAVSTSSVFTSTNFGASWISNTVSSYGFKVCASSADGTTLMAGGVSGPISISTNSGMTWTQELFGGGWNSFTASPDGSKLVAMSIAPSLVYSSTNFGGSWLSNNVIPSLSFQYVASSADGVKLVLVGKGGGIYTSTNAGNTWVSNNVPNEQWSSVASSADGNALIATVQGGGIWTSHTTPMPQLNLTASNANLALFWLIPSTNFVLQQSPDLISWSSVTDTPTLNLTSLNYELTLSPSNNIGFYRLATP